MFSSHRPFAPAHRARRNAAQLAAEEAARQARIQEERVRLCKCYGHLLPGTLDLLQSFQSRVLVEKVIAVIRAEQDWTRQTEQQARSVVIEELLLAGEQLGFPKLTNDDFILESGVESWLSFVEEAHLPVLYQACDMVHIKIQAAAGRKRLVQLAP